MRFLAWLLLAVSVVANVYANTFSGYTGAAHVVASVVTGAVVLGSAAVLWFTRRRAA
ncbi:hypothetical protein [Streptomyces sp. NPDC058955]|uniref:hypothetical protein n=1 Tax=unclassified Streptomyces TaxID=2593676 RepID=UPI003667A2D8